MKKLLMTAIKVGLVAAIFVWLFYRATGTDVFQKIAARSPDWRFVPVVFLLNLATVLLTFFRWRALVHALGIPLTRREMFRYSFLGYAINLAPMGTVGGDVVRAWLLVRRYPGTTDRAVASAIMDRVIGLYVMFLFACVMVVATGFIHYEAYEARFATTLAFALAGITTAGLAVVLVPDSSLGLRRRLVGSLPLLGRPLCKIMDAMQMYRRHWGTLFYCLFLTLWVHILFAISLWVTSLGLFGYSPAVLDQFTASPLANIGSIIPLAAGPLEYGLDVLYPLFTIPGHESYQPGYGTLIGLAFRAISIFLAGIGGIYYLTSRSEVSAALESMKAEQQERREEQEQEAKSGTEHRNSKDQEDSGAGENGAGTNGTSANGTRFEKASDREPERIESR